MCTVGLWFPPTEILKPESTQNTQNMQNTQNTGEWLLMANIHSDLESSM